MKNHLIHNFKQHVAEHNAQFQESLKTQTPFNHKLERRSKKHIIEEQKQLIQAELTKTVVS